MLEKTPNRAAALVNAAKTFDAHSEEFFHAVEASQQATRTLFDLAVKLFGAGKAGPRAIEAWTDFVQQIVQWLLGEQLRLAKQFDREMAQMEADLALAECFGKAKWPQRKRGRRSQTAGRDLVIAGAVSLVVHGARFSPTRNHAAPQPAGPSACSIVRAALAQVGLHLSERTIEEIWSNRHKPARP
jgi:hypothetical protein